MRSSLAYLAAVLAVPGLPAQTDYKPAIPIKEASKEGLNAIRKFEYAKDLECKLWAAEPMLANPVAFCVDARGRLFVCETFRLHKGVTDNRSWKNWIDDELACRTVEDRVAMYRRKFPDTIADWEREHERIQLLEDSDGDGKADRSTIYAQGFKQLADGIAAGILSRGRDVWYTCIPNVWKLTDKDGDGKADARKVLHHGYGVHTALLGHDLHGLRQGPDGRLYFSIGDRGFHIETEGRVVSMPDEGAVLRCNPDGSHLEVVHRGLRNPQELAFDRFGNLFTGDNNSDGGDKARWVYVVEGGNSGWQIGWQSLPDRGPWNAEHLWWPQFDGQAAYIVPPIANFTNGPSGLAYDPGTGLPARYRDCFLLCDFRGASAVSGIWACRAVPKGAGFELTTTVPFIWKVLATDVDFGTDGSVYLTDWTEGWGQTGKGRIYKIVAPATAKSAPVVETKRLLAEGMHERTPTDLAALLDHADQRVRQEAQFELVKRREAALLEREAKQRDRRMARIHAIWGLGQLGLENPKAVAVLADLLSDLDEEVRCQTAKVFGWARYKQGRAALIRALRDRSSRVRFFAAISLGQIGAAEALDPLIDVLRINEDRDVYLRHAAVIGLVGTGDVGRLLAWSGDSSRSVRLGVLLALRRLRRPEIATFLDDADVDLVAEAARAVHDEWIAPAVPQLAALLTRRGFERRPILSRAVLSRAINANFRLATNDCIERLLAFVLRSDAPAARRAEALRCFADWAEPSGRDRVLNRWRPLPHRPLEPVVARLQSLLPVVLRLGPDSLRREALRLAAKLEIKTLEHDVASIAGDAKRHGETRAVALETLDTLGSKRVAALAEQAARGARGRLRSTCLRILTKAKPESAVALLEAVLASKAGLAERQTAIELLGRVDADAARARLGDMLAALVAGRLEKALALDVVEAARASKDPGLTKTLAAWEAKRKQAGKIAEHAITLFGGAKHRGRRIFETKVSTNCKRCHTIDGKGGLTGPDLLGVGTRLTRTEILEALIDPSKRIAEGFGTYVLELKNGDVVSGQVKPVDKRTVKVIPEEGEPTIVKKDDIDFESEPNSAMPPVSGLLTHREIRDLIAFLTSLTK